jgi:hypothetical protein
MKKGFLKRRLFSLVSVRGCLNKVVDCKLYPGNAELQLGNSYACFDPATYKVIFLVG